MRQNLIILLLIALLTGCEDQSTIGSREYAVVQTEVKEITNEGVRLAAKILSRGKSEISAAGFLFGKGSEAGFRLVVEDFNDSFEYFLRTDIAEGEDFFVKAYVVSGDRVSYGNIEIFKSKGYVRLPAQVIEVTPRVVSDSYRVLITGKNFSLVPGKNRVFINGNGCAVLYTGFDTIEFIIPVLTAGTHRSYLKIYEEEVEFGEMNVRLPEITSYEPKQGFSGSEVTIRGKFFGKNLRKIYFGNAQGIQVFGSDTLIICKVPQTTQRGPVSLKVDVTGKVSVGGEQFTLLAPPI